MAQESTDENQTLETGAGESQETENSTTESAVDVNALQEQNRQLLARARKAEAKAKQLSANKQEAVSTDDNQQEPPSQVSDDRFDRLELKTEGYSNAEIDSIMELGGKTALANPVVVKAIDLMRKEAKSKDATPSGTNKSPVYQKFSEKDLKKMPLEEFENLVSEM